MSKPSIKKFKRREHKQSLAKVHERERAGYLGLFNSLPTIDFRQQPNCDPDFAKIVRRAWKDLILHGPIADNYQPYFWHKLLLFLRCAKSHGFKHALRQTQEIIRTYPDLETEITIVTSNEFFASQIFGRMRPDDRLCFFPFDATKLTSLSTFNVEFGRPSDNAIMVEMETLPSKHTSGGTVYFSRCDLELEINGRCHQLAFSKHAVGRMRERVFGTLPEDIGAYITATLTFRLLSDLLNVEACVLDNGDIAAKVYAHDIGRLNPDLPEAVLGRGFRSGKCYDLLIGYCPIRSERDLAVATTLLNPRMSQTPERALVDLRKVDLYTYRTLNTPYQPIVERLLTGEYRDVALMQECGFEQIRAVDAEE